MERDKQTSETNLRAKPRASEDDKRQLSTVIENNKLPANSEVDAESLRPIATNADEDNPSTDTENAAKTSNPAPKDEIQQPGDSTTQATPNCRDNIANNENPQAAEPKEKADPESDKTADGSVKRDSLVATVKVITNLMKWQLKAKKQAGIKVKSMEKYKGHLEVIQRRSQQEKVDLPFPIRLNIKMEVLPIIHSIVKDYKLSLGPNHKLTQEAMAKEKQLQAELTEDGVFL